MGSEGPTILRWHDGPPSSLRSLDAFLRILTIRIFYWTSWPYKCRAFAWLACACLQDCKTTHTHPPTHHHSPARHSLPLASCSRPVLCNKVFQQFLDEAQSILCLCRANRLGINCRAVTAGSLSLRKPHPPTSFPRSPTSSGLCSQG